MIQLDYRDGRPIYEQVKDGFKKLILSGALKEGEKLPSVRELSTLLAVNPNTILGPGQGDLRSLPANPAGGEESLAHASPPGDGLGPAGPGRHGGRASKGIGGRQS